MIGFVVFITAAAWLITEAMGLQTSIVGPAIMLSGVFSLGSYWFSDKLVLASTGAKPATREEYFDYYTTVENLALGQKLPMPKLYVIESPALNAFATGRNYEKGVVCATTGLLQRLDRAEIEAVMAHELSHIKNYDIRLMAIVTVLIGSIATLAEWTMRMRFWGGGDADDRKAHPLLAVLGIALALLAPFIGQLLQLAISRRREFLADASAVAMTRNPQGLINALTKISTSSAPLQTASAANAHLFISNPFKGQRLKQMSKLFMTHPPIEERIAALKAL